MTKITQLTNQLGEILLPHGYKKAGKNYYRVQGNGVVVFFYFEYDPGDRGHHLSFGFDSLYNSDLNPPKELNMNPSFHLLSLQELKEFSFDNWFSITPPTNELLQSIVLNDSSTFYKCLYKGVEEQNQKRNSREFEILQATDFLFRVDNLQDFMQTERMIIELTERDYPWTKHNSTRFYELLSVGRYEDAISLFRSTEKQNYWTMYEKAITKAHLYPDYNLEEDRVRSEKYLAPRRKFIFLLEANKTEEVQERLREIYAHNLATFGVRKKRGKTSPKEK